MLLLALVRPRLKSLKLQLAEESDVLLRSYDRPGARRVGGRRPGERETRNARAAGDTRRARRVAVRASLRRDYEPLYVCASREVERERIDSLYTSLYTM